MAKGWSQKAAEAKAAPSAPPFCSNFSLDGNATKGKTLEVLLSQGHTLAKYRPNKAPSTTFGQHLACLWPPLSPFLQKKILVFIF